MNNADDQYLILLNKILTEGTKKPGARKGMPGSLSLFGYQFRHNLQHGFPLLTTKKLHWKGIVTELLWFLRGDTNIKYLVDNGVNIWNEDSYRYYVQIASQNTDETWNDIYHDNEDGTYRMFTYEEFVDIMKNENVELRQSHDYVLGNCGFQYGKVWRRWRSPHMAEDGTYVKGKTDQISNLIKGLKNNPESRRHIVTAIDPAHDQDLALYWCHAMFQFNCRPLSWEEKLQWAMRQPDVEMENLYITEAASSERCPKYYLDCHLYQRSADVFLGVPYNIASYGLLTHIISRICNMIPGDFIHSFGDVHIYDNHIDQVKEQLTRQPKETPSLKFLKTNKFWETFNVDLFSHLDPSDFVIENYNPHPAIKAKLSTGLKK